MNIVAIRKVFKEIEGIYIYTNDNIFSKSNPDQIIKNENKKHIGHGLSTRGTN